MLARKDASSITPKTRRKLTVFKQTILFLAAFTLITLAIYALLEGPVGNWFVLRYASPTMIKLATDADMSKKGEILFLRAKPLIANPAQFTSDCTTAATNKTGTSVLGCYIPSTNRIYLLKMPSDLYDEEVTTAAYEMLHIAYLKQSGSQLTKLNADIESDYNNLSPKDTDLSGQVTTFAQTEPGARDLELYSILCTEYGDISVSLSSYCSPYFSDSMSSVLADNQYIDSLFQNYQNQLNQINSTITQDENNAKTAYADSVSWAEDGDQYEDNYNYNIYTNDYNSANSAIQQYNSTVGAYNTLVTAITGGQPINQQGSVQQQSNQ